MTIARFTVVLAALALSAGCAGTTTQSAPPSTAATPQASADASPSADPLAGVADFTCLQIEQAFSGAYDMPTPPAAWVTGVLTALVKADGATGSPTGEPLTKYTADLRKACADPAVSHESARLIGTRVYQAAKPSYQPAS